MEASEPSSFSHEWHVVAVSVAGTSHEKFQKPCQDASRWQRLPNGLLVAAVADGAGSASLAEIGSALAVATAVDFISRKTDGVSLPEDDNEWKVLLKQALLASLTAIEAEANARQIAARHLATTLIVVVATSSLVVAAQIGDGAALVRDSSGNLLALTRPSHGEYVNETTFIVSPNAIETAQFNLWKWVASGITAFSDGLQMVALNMQDGAPHAPFFSPLFRFVGAASDLEQAANQL